VRWVREQNTESGLVTGNQSKPETGLPLGARFTLPLYFAMTLPAVLVARGVNALFVSLVIGALIGAAYKWRGELETVSNRVAPSHTRNIVGLGLVFAGYAALSALWSVVPGISLMKGLMLAGIIFATTFALRAATTTDSHTLDKATTGFLLAMIVGALFLLIEIAFDQRLMRWIYELFPSLGEGHTNLRYRAGRVLFLWEGDHNRVTCVVALLLLPAWVAARATANRHLRQWAYGVFTALFVAVLWKSEHQSSQLALAIAALFFALVQLRLRAAKFVAYAGWSLAVLLIVPLSYWLFHSVELHKAGWLFRSAESRVVVWGYTAEKVTQRPLLGIGAHATSSYNDQQLKLDYVKTSSRKKRIPMQVHHHAHNVYLQTWFELGAVGAMLLLLWGLAAIRAVTTLPPTEAGLWLTQLTATAVMAATSYGMWQFWFLVSMASAFILLWISTLVLRERRQVEGSNPLHRAH
jgi:O-antigen ligase